MIKVNFGLYSPMMSCGKIIIGVLGWFFIQLTYAQNISPAQIEQFQRLPRAQQEALARQMGIDLDALQQLQNQSPTAIQPEPITQRPSVPDNSGDDIEEVASEGTDELSLEEDTSESATREKLKLFGHDIFQFGPATFTPATDIPVPANYVLGPGDTLIIQLFGKENYTHTLTLNREGQVLFPSIGPITLAGMTFSAASAKIDQVVSEQMIGIKSSVTMGPLRTIRVFVLGDVSAPGSYVVSSLSTMSNAIFTSGGITQIGSLRNIQLKRAGKVVTTLDLYDLLLQGDTSKDSRLLPGDVIFVPPIGRTVSIAGEVKRPAIYELQKENTVKEVISLAGGALPTAFLPATRIERITQSGDKTIHSVNPATLEGAKAKIKDADVIQLFATLDTLEDVVLLEGHVKRPGGFQWRQGMRFTDIVSNIKLLHDNPDTTVALIQRETPDAREKYAVTFSPRKAWNNPGGSEDILLQNRDNVIIFNYLDNRAEMLMDITDHIKSHADFNQPEQVVVINGSILFPGEYPLVKGMTVKQIIDLAGGLSESASGIDAEITRHRFDENRQLIAAHIPVDLKNSDPELEPGDAITVKQVPFWNERKSVEIRGEVISPGVYTILPGEKLSDVLLRAGGLTPYAFVPGAIYSREDLREVEQERLDELKIDIQKEIAAANLTGSNVRDKVGQEETDQIIENVDNVTARGRMVIDLQAILDDPQGFDFDLSNGDVIEIPHYKPTVTVIGEVQHSTSHFYNPKLSIKDYLKRSGGTKQNADESRIYVVRANGQVYVPNRRAWFKKRSQRLAAGDTIIVPIDADNVDRLTFWGSVTSIMADAAVGIAAIRSL